MLCEQRLLLTAPPRWSCNAWCCECRFYTQMCAHEACRHPLLPRQSLATLRSTGRTTTRLLPFTTPPQHPYAPSLLLRSIQHTYTIRRETTCPLTIAAFEITLSVPTAIGGGGGGASKAHHPRHADFGFEGFLGIRTLGMGAPRFGLGAPRFGLGAPCLGAPGMRGTEMGERLTFS